MTKRTNPAPSSNATAPRGVQAWIQKQADNPASIVFVLAACLVCLAYTRYTKQTWEDSLITLRHSENLLKGEGLTYNPGTRVHGFTSPINVLLLAVCHFATGQTSYVATFWLYRTFTIAAFAASGVLLLKALNQTPPQWNIATWFLGIVYLFDVKTVAFTTNGMETGFMLLFVAWAVYLTSQARPDLWLMRGLCWGGLMWTRPDGCVYIAALSLAELIFLTTDRPATLRSFFKSAAVCLAVYGPWLLWASSYYGSPIPHTIIAKANAEQGPLIQLRDTLDQLVSGLISAASQAFRPIYAEDPQWLKHPVWTRAFTGATESVGIVALLYFIYPTNDRFGRAMSFSFVILCGYMSYMPIKYPWYLPPVALLGATAFTRAATMLALTPAGRESTTGLWWFRKATVSTTLIAIAIGAIALFYPASLKERIQQAEIEMGNRAQIGTWLKENASPTDNVYLEPLGYIGYFSGLRMDDFPGLVSPEVVDARRQLPPTNLAATWSRLLIIPKLKPTWVVLRYNEYKALTQLPIADEFKRDYVFFRKFDVNDNISKHHYLPGEFSLRYDAGFVVFRRNTTAS